ncbi:uncharacterized protein LOC121233364 [Aquila chrysaetos chrysaetos]|uniref:uncharacterized protein LOC121233364 n=1 Tax=Aquila chrysaetos chrysaetos TaxID=223781 RepID=UPI001B7D308A|nr:uncharacterized protein LOC121233364 [Aquila chrysaetos chrysaetos]
MASALPSLPLHGAYPPRLAGAGLPRRSQTAAILLMGWECSLRPPSPQCPFYNSALHVTLNGSGLGAAETPDCGVNFRHKVREKPGRPAGSHTRRGTYLRGGEEGGEKGEGAGALTETRSGRCGGFDRISPVKKTVEAESLPRSVLRLIYKGTRRAVNEPRFPFRERHLGSRYGLLLSGPAGAGKARGSPASQGRRSFCRLHGTPLPSTTSPPSSCSARTPPCLPCPASAPPAIRLIEGGEAVAGVSFDAHQGLSEPPSVRKLGAPDKSWAGSSYPASMEPPQSGDWRSS